MEARRLVLIANPAAGTRRARSAAGAFATRVAEAGFELEVHETEYAGHARELSRTLDLDGVHALCPVGGDGTVHEVVCGLMSRDDGSRPPLCVVPAGSGNALALDLGYNTPGEAAERLVRGALRDLDVARVDVDGQILYSINLLAWGAAARINARAERLRLFGGARYSIAAAIELLRPRLGTEAARVDGKRRPDVLLGAACITRHSGRGMQLAPDARLDDGLFDVLTLRRGGRMQLARVLSAVYDGSHVTSPLVRIERRPSLTLELDAGERLVVDGELLDAHHIRARVCPGDLRVHG